MTKNREWDPVLAEDQIVALLRQHLGKMAPDSTLAERFAMPVDGPTFKIRCALLPERNLRNAAKHLIAILGELGRPGYLSE